ncbi:MAG: signal peptidase II [Phycisphaerales bacterium]
MSSPFPPTPSPPPAPPAPPAASTFRRAGSSRGAWLVLLAVTLSTLALDLWTKSWAFATVAGRPVAVDREQVLAIARVDPTRIGHVLPEHDPVVVIPRVLEFTLVLNSGAVFGMGPGQRWYFMSFTAAALVFALVLFARWTRAGDWPSHAAVGMLISGGLGNFYDRIVFGCVRDFIHPLPGVKWPFGWRPLGGTGELWPYVSNVADAFLLIGIAILAWRLWRHDPARPSAEPTAPAPGAR